MRVLIAVAMVPLLSAFGSAIAGEAQPESPVPSVRKPDPFSPGEYSLVYSVEGLSGDDPNGVSLQGLRVSVGPWIEDEYYGRVCFWGAYQHGDEQTVSSAGGELAMGLPLGPFRILPRFRVGFEYRAQAPDDGIAGLAGLGIELSVWLGRHLQLAVSRDRDFGFPSGTRDLSGIALRWAHVPGPYRLKDAAYRRDRDEAHRLIQAGVRMDKEESHEALYAAAGGCDSALVQMLLEAWKGPPDNYSELALHTVVRSCEPDLTATLLRWGQDPNADYYLGHTTLMIAAEGGKMEAARLLLQAGAKVDGRGRYKGWVQEEACRATPLMIAAARDDRQMVDLLIDAGAEIGLSDSSGCTAEEAARNLGHADLAEHIRLRRPATADATEKPAPPPPGNR